MIEELKSWKGIRVEGIIFKDAVYLCERYQLYRVKHPNLGFLMCQVLPKKESVEDFYTSINGVKISERYKYHDYFTEALFIYRDDLYEYVFFHNFQTLGEIIAKRI
ncbi:MAG: hypothetical protein K1X26_05215 [Chitinophagales bacterium]|nr:hypothetical protein [Chitinophagales bacterium]